MSSTETHPYVDVFEGPQSKLEYQYIDEYLKSQGYQWADLCLLPEKKAKQLMIAASRYATIKLAEHEARAKFRREIHIE